MSRSQGLFPFSANFEPRLAAPLDARIVVNNVSNLTNTNYWLSRDNNTYLYKGIAVSVWDDTIDNNGIYILTSNDYTNIENWLKVGSSSEINLEDSESISFTKSGLTYSAFIKPDSITVSGLKTVAGDIIEGYVLSNDGEGNFKWIESNEFKINNTDTISFTKSGLTYSAFINPDSITVSGLKTIDGSATASYLLSNDGNGNFKWVEPIPSEGAITMEDYTTGESFTNVQNIIIRGGAITVPGGTAIGSLASKTSLNTVTVWIPAPNYAPLFNPILNVTSSTRFISKPSNNSDLGVNIGDFGIGDWNIDLDYTNNILRNVTNLNNIVDAFTTPEFFNCYGINADGIGTTMSFTVFDSNDNIIASIENFEINESNLQVKDHLTIIVTDFQNDSDRKKAKVSGSININNLIPNGGRFYYNIKHYNNDINNPVLSFTSSQYFFDSPGNQGGLNSTSKINGSILFDELSVVNRFFSGVSYYTNGSTFGITVSGIDLLNQITFPSDNRQIQLTSNNMLINSFAGVNLNTMRGYTDGSKGFTGINGWSIDWNSSGLTFSTFTQVNINNSAFPGFSPNTTNNILSTPSSSIKADTYDYGIADTKLSDPKLMLFDTLTLNSGSHNLNPIIGEGNRLSVSSLLNSESLLFDSTVLPDDELQYIFGRIIYPQHNFSDFYPSYNSSIDYSNLSGSNKTFQVYTDLNIISTDHVNINDYRWYVTNPYGVNSLYNIDFTNGIFTFNCNFTENDLDYKPISNTGGNGDLVIMLGIDPGVNGSYPTNFIYLTGDVNSYPGRSGASTYNFDNTTKSIQFTTGQISGVRKVWLFIGYKNTTRGKSLILSNIQFS